ncbi:hypothetical protein [Paraburkholderia sp. D1E]|uniref:hypothetical protein n=1 Tax=Paraburkholderia sp. D1E TaxID=3461398 RepID=UPI0040465CD5
MNKKMSAIDARSDNVISSGNLGPLALDELTIIIRPSGIAMAKYIGTRLQLETEGVIPAGTTWPNGFDSVSWKANGLEFHLVRVRPDGAKGPRRAFLDCDNWCLRVERLDWNWPDEAIKVQAIKLNRLLYAQTAEGRAAFHQNFAAYWAAKRDEKFQTFKALIPGLVPPPRKRRRPSDDQPETRA